MDEGTIPLLSALTITTPFMGIYTIDPLEWLDATPATWEMIERARAGDAQRTLAIEDHVRLCRDVIATGQSHTVMEWSNETGQWRKSARTKSHMGGGRIFEISQDVTDLDPRAPWLARIDLAAQRLVLDNGESISFNEFLTLHLILKGMKHVRIAETLSISPKTIEYRLDRIKAALGVRTAEEMMIEVTSSGLVHLATFDFDYTNPATTELELYSRIPG